MKIFCQKNYWLSMVLITLLLELATLPAYAHRCNRGLFGGCGSHAHPHPRIDLGGLIVDKIGRDSILVNYDVYPHGFKVFMNFTGQDRWYSWQASGFWSGKIGYPAVNANGINGCFRSRNIVPSLPCSSLVVQRSDWYNHQYLTDQFGISGRVFVRHNDYIVFKFNDYPDAYGDNRGRMRIILTP